MAATRHNKLSVRSIRVEADSVSMKATVSGERAARPVRRRLVISNVSAGGQLG